MKLVSWLAVLIAILPACSRGGYDPEDGNETPMVVADDCAATASTAQELKSDGDFVLRPEYDCECKKSKGAIDVNLGNAPEAFVRAAQCQITGTEPDAATITELSEQLRSTSYVRRVDVVRTLCTRAGRTCVMNYTDPWQTQLDLSAACVRKGTRDLGAVLMYWSECPGGVNCGLDWANTHAAGMNTASSLLAFGDAPTGFYSPRNAGFWERELQDARWSGLQFLLLNTFGPDLAHVPTLVQALDNIGGGIQVALFDDTWGWGKGGALPWSQMPSFNDAESAAQLIYQKWHLFYTAVPSKYWYRYNNRPLIAFYNAGTLNPQTKSAATLARLRELFTAEFHEDPFLVIDRAFFQDPATNDVADAQFRWNTFDAGALSHSDMKGVTFDHFMAKWDSIGRENNQRLAEAKDRVIKGPELLDKYLEDSASSNLAMMATWNDLGEGTGLTRNFDYYYQGAWLPPNAFMSHIRKSQCQ